MLLDQINLNQLRVFECVYEKGSMTEAALELHLTQSGVSQHIKALEEALGLSLFDRMKQRLIPTPSGENLYARCRPVFENLEQTLSEIKGEEKVLKGNLTIGMPIEFGNNVIMPLLGKFSQKHPLVRFQIRLGFAYEMGELLLNGKMDLAFIDNVHLDRRIETEKVYDEKLGLYASRVFYDKALKGPPSRANLEALPLVCYQEDAPVLKMWFQHHFNVKRPSLFPRAVVMDVQGVARLILEGVGVGVLPRHFLKTQPQIANKLTEITVKKIPLKNSIQLATLHGKTPKKEGNALIEYLKPELLKLDQR